MDALEQIVLTGQTSARITRGALTAPFARVGAIALAPPLGAALAVAMFAHPLLSPVMVPLLRALGGEAVLHYPQTFDGLPQVMARLGQWTAWLGLPLLAGWFAMLSTPAGRSLPVFGALTATLARLPRLLLVGSPLALAHGAVAGAMLDALLDLPRRRVSAIEHLLAAAVGEALILVAAAWVLPALLRPGLPLRDVPDALRHDWRYGGVAMLALGGGLAVAAVTSRIVIWAVARVVTSRLPEAMLGTVLAGSVLTTLGIMVLAGTGRVLHDAVDEGWA